MTKLKIYIEIDKKTGELMSFETSDQYIFEKRKKDVVKEYDGEIKEAIIEIRIKGIDY